tara:strand:- start:155 stop:916 length:762 start_codon:yes stop_codon:yes gene_type:complete
MRFLVTSGGTRAFIDEVRHVGNMSRGTFGTEIAKKVLAGDHELSFLRAKESKAPHLFQFNLLGERYAFEAAVKSLSESWDLLMCNISRYDCYEYDTPEEYGTQLYQLSLQLPDVIILAAAVSDFAPERTGGKISSDIDRLHLDMAPTPKFIRSIRKWSPNSFIVGFKLLVGSTQEELEDAMTDQKNKAGVDMVVGNDLRDIRADKHKLTLLSIDNEFYEYGPSSGHDMANMLVDAIVSDKTSLDTERQKQEKK